MPCSCCVFCVAGIRQGEACSPVDLVQPVLASLAPDLLQSIRAYESKDGSCRWGPADACLMDQPGYSSSSHERDDSHDVMHEFLLTDLFDIMLLVLQPAVDYGECK